MAKRKSEKHVEDMLIKIEGGWEVLPRKADINRELPCKRAHYGNEVHIKMVYCGLTKGLCAHIVYVKEKRLYWMDEERIKMCPGMKLTVTDDEIRGIQEKAEKLKDHEQLVQKYLEIFEKGKCPPIHTDCIPQSDYCNKKLCWAEAFKKLLVE